MTIKGNKASKSGRGVTWAKKMLWYDLLLQKRHVGAHMICIEGASKFNNLNQYHEKMW
jgi:hypothetical protein